MSSARRRKPHDAGERHAIAANLLDRQFEAEGPNLKWAADFTYLWTHEGWLFVAVVIDLFSRRVVGWAANARMTAVGDGRADDGDLASWRSTIASASFRPGQPTRALPGSARGARHHLQHEPTRELLGQLSHRKLLRLAEN
jgi:putative transposase